MVGRELSAFIHILVTPYSKSPNDLPRCFHVDINKQRNRTETCSSPFYLDRCSVSSIANLYSTFGKTIGSANVHLNWVSGCWTELDFSSCLQIFPSDNVIFPLPQVIHWNFSCKPTSWLPGSSWSFMTLSERLEVYKAMNELHIDHIFFNWDNFIFRTQSVIEYTRMSTTYTECCNKYCWATL